MSNQQRVHVIGYDEVVLMLRIIGFEGTILDDPKKFKVVFERLKEDPSIGMIIVAMNLPDELITYLLRFKLDNRRPFIYLLPRLFQTRLTKKSEFIERVYKSITKLLS